MFQQPELSRRQIERLARDPDAVLEPIELDRAIDQNFRATGTATTNHRAHAGQQFIELEWLGQVVVGAGIEPAHHIFRGISCGQHDDWRLTPLTTQFGRDLKAILLRQHQVEQDDIVRVDVRQRCRLIAIRRVVNDVPLLTQPLGDETGDLSIVLHNENPHGRIIEGAITSADESDMKRSSSNGVDR